MKQDKHVVFAYTRAVFFPNYNLLIPLVRLQICANFYMYSLRLHVRNQF